MSSGLNSFLKGFDNKEDSSEIKKEETQPVKENIQIQKPVERKVNKLKLNIRQVKPTPEMDQNTVQQQEMENNQRLYQQQILQKQKRQEEYNQQEIKNREQISQPAQKIPKAKQKVSIPVQKTKDKGDSQEVIDRLFYESETSSEFKDEWVETYIKGLKSIKKNATVRKIVNGRFRIMSGGRMEILPELKTHGMSTMDLLNTKWLE